MKRFIGFFAFALGFLPSLAFNVNASPMIKTIVLPFTGINGDVLSNELSRVLMKSDEIAVWEERNFPVLQPRKFTKDFLKTLQGAGITEGVVIGGNISLSSASGQTDIEVLIYNLSSGDVHDIYSSVQRDKVIDDMNSLGDSIVRFLTGKPLIRHNDFVAHARWAYLGTPEFQNMRKSMLFPGLISIIIPGAGHIYTGEYVKGCILFPAAVGSLLLWGGGTYTHNGKTVWNTQGVIGYISWFSITLYAGIDAGFSANRYNRRLLEHINISIGPEMGISLTQKF